MSLWVYCILHCEYNMYKTWVLRHDSKYYMHIYFTSLEICNLPEVTSCLNLKVGPSVLRSLYDVWVWRVPSVSRYIVTEKMRTHLIMINSHSEELLHHNSRPSLLTPLNTVAYPKLWVWDCILIFLTYQRSYCVNQWSLRNCVEGIVLFAMSDLCRWKIMHMSASNNKIWAWFYAAIFVKYLQKNEWIKS